MGSKFTKGADISQRLLRDRVLASLQSRKDCRPFGATLLLQFSPFPCGGVGSAVTTEHHGQIVDKAMVKPMRHMGRVGIKRAGAWGLHDLLGPPSGCPSTIHAAPSGLEPDPVVRTGGVRGWSLLLFFFKFVQQRHGFGQSISSSVKDSSSDLALLGILFGRVA
jgi:hypothetical protein